MDRIDLHVHTTASDGRYSPSEIVRIAAERGLSAIAITDHDTVDGIAEALDAARAFPGLTMVPGVEISADSTEGEIHILGYFVDFASEEMKAALEKSRNSRQVRADAMLARLGELGINVSRDRVIELAGSASLGRPHIARAMLEKGHVSSLHEAFEKYIGHGRPAYVRREKMAPEDAVRLVSGAGGLAALAHPFTAVGYKALIARLKPTGLAAIEAYYNGYNEDDIAMLVSIAKKYDLVPTGGSDYHGLEENAETSLGGVDIPYDTVKQLTELAQSRSKVR
jgi:predicted metal-dependent phosphoesterase TrpH